METKSKQTTLNKKMFLLPLTTSGTTICISPQIDIMTIYRRYRWQCATC